MQIFKYLIAALPVVWANNTLYARDAALVAQDIGAIAQGVAALNNSVVAYAGAARDAVTIQQQSSTVLKAIQKATTDANNSPPFNDDESLAVGIPVVNLQPDVETLLDNLQGKKQTFGSFGSVVRSQLVSQKQATLQLGDAITPKLTPDFQAVAPGIIKALSDKFDETIAVYS